MHTFSVNQSSLYWLVVSAGFMVHCFFSWTKSFTVQHSQTLEYGNLDLSSPGVPSIHIKKIQLQSHKPNRNLNIKFIIHLLNEQPQIWAPVLNLNLSVKPCNKAEIHFRFVLSDQSAECLLGDQMEQREGNNSESVEGLKHPLIKYIPLQKLLLNFKTVMQTLIVGHGLSLYSSAILFEDYC